jgi:short-subunit dehydrogenase
MTKTFLPYLLKRPEAHIANVSSMGAFLPVPGQTLYGASKAAVKLMTEGLHSELMDTNVHVTVVFPGSIKTNITVNSGVMMPGQRSEVDDSKMKLTLPEVAAETIINGIEQNKYQVYIGNDSKMLSLYTRIAPKRAARFIFEQMKSLLN